MISEKVKKIAFETIRYRPINAGVRGILKPFSQVLPYRFIVNVPVVGEIHLELPDSKELILVSDGYDSLATRIYWNGAKGFEPETLDLFNQLLERAVTVIDVGAHVGLFALIAAINNREREVHAFEPVPRVYDYFLENIVANDLENITAIPDAVTDFDGQITLHIPDTMRLQATASTLEDYRAGTDELVVSAIKLDTYVSAHHIERVDLIKIDAEGTEAQVLRGAGDILSQDKPAIICEVLHGYVSDSLQAVFDDTDYLFFLITDNGLVLHEDIVGDETYFYKNYLLISKSRLAEMLPQVNIL